MKRILVMSITVCLILSLVGCSGSSAPKVTNDDNTALEQILAQTVRFP